MERLLQYLDDVDDLFGLFGLLYERLRTLLLMFAALVGVLTVLGTAVWIALAHPPAALAVGTILFVMLLYRSVTAPMAQPTA